jgi:hypothetical protein
LVLHRGILIPFVVPRIRPSLTELTTA